MVPDNIKSLIIMCWSFVANTDFAFVEPCCQLLSIKGELFDTFRKRHHGSELADVKLTTESLHRCIHIFVVCYCNCTE